MAAKGLAGKHDVLVLEEHASSGTPSHCAGLVTDDVLRMSGVRSDVFNRLHGAEVIFPDGRSVIARSKDAKASVINRIDLDQLMAESAMDAGAEFRFGERYVQHEVSDMVTVRSEHGSFVSRSIVGADGQASKVALSLGDNRPREYLRGIQADVSIRMDDQDLFRIRLGSEHAPGFFTWEIPCGDFTRVGLCVNAPHLPNEYLGRLLRGIGAEDKVIRTYAGRIPVGGRSITYGDRCLLTGDAAGLVKPVSGGGLYPTFKTMPILVDVLSNALDSDDLFARSMSDYERRWRELIGKELSRGYSLRKMFKKMDDGDLIRAGQYASREDVGSALNDIDLDHPSDVVRAVMKRPRAMLSAIPLVLRCIF